MNYQYRIKVEEKNNGEKLYIPQVGTPKLKILSRTQHLWLEWDNLYPNLLPSYTYDPTTQLPSSKNYKIESASINTFLTAASLLYLIISLYCCWICILSSSFIKLLLSIKQSTCMKLILIFG